MKIDNSALVAFWKCPLYFQEIYLNKTVQPQPSYYAFGQRWHQYLQHYYQKTELPAPPEGFDILMEAEIASMFEAYKATYPVEPFEIVDCEKYFEIPFGELGDYDEATKKFKAKHTYVGKMDMLVRDKASGALSLFETKTEKRGSRRNLPEAWMARTQGSLYVWAAQSVYGESIDNIILNICTKGSDKGKIGPGFRRDTLERSKSQIETALSDLTYVADTVEALSKKGGDFPANRNACVDERGFKCPYYLPHVEGWTDEIKSQFVTIEPFAHLGL